MVEPNIIFELSELTIMDVPTDTGTRDIPEHFCLIPELVILVPE